jgi:hypothetical protein
MAWPGPHGKRHMLVIGVGCRIDAPNEVIETAKRLAKEAPRHLMGKDSDLTPAPNAIEEWSDLAQVSSLHRINLDLYTNHTRFIDIRPELPKTVECKKQI